MKKLLVFIIMFLVFANIALAQGTDTEDLDVTAFMNLAGLAPQ